MRVWTDFSLVLCRPALPTLVLSMGVAAGVAAQTQLPNQILQDCHLESVQGEVACGSVRVPEARGGSAGVGRSLELKVLVLKALGEPKREDPLVVLAGGPGGAATDMAPAVSALFQLLRRNRDVVLIDQRGTGGSHRLDCNLYEDHDPLGDRFPVEAVRNCREALIRRADLSQYSTDAAVDDLEDARRRLGYEQINLFGGSYGSQLALAYLSKHEKNVRSLVLAGVVPLDARESLSYAGHGDRSVDLLVDECRRDADCSTAYPSFEQELHAVLLRAETAGPKFQADKGTAAAPHLNRGVLGEGVWMLLHESGTRRQLPLLIHQAYLGNFKPLASRIAEMRVRAAKAVAIGLYLSVACAEDLSSIDEGTVTNLTQSTVLGRYRFDQQRAACAVWDVPPSAEESRRIPRSEVPALLISGRLDPNTPPSSADRVATYLEQAVGVVIPHAPHELGGLSNLECLIGMISGFVETRGSKGVDATCVESMLPPPFTVTDNLPDRGDQLPRSKPAPP